jgi:hypothetical protein
MYPAMLRPSATAAKLRSWRVIIMHSKGGYLGSVEAFDRQGPTP